MSMKVKEFVVYRGTQPVFTDEDRAICESYVRNQKLEMKRQGIDSSIKENELSIV